MIIKNIYVAGKWEDKINVRRIQNMLRDRGYNISFDWTAETIYSNRPDCAYNDYVGVADSDCLVIYCKENLNYSGTLTEFGIALGVGIPVIMVGEGLSKNIFYNLHDEFKDVPVYKAEDEGECLFLLDALVVDLAYA